jgi:gp16 family phage-associated protein
VRDDLEDVRNAFRVRGISIAAWARSRGHAPPLVYPVHTGRYSCSRGQSHAIAVALGIKAGIAASVEDLEQVFARRRIATGDRVADPDSRSERDREDQPMT